MDVAGIVDIRKIWESFVAKDIRLWDIRKGYCDVK